MRSAYIKILSIGGLSVFIVFSTLLAQAAESKEEAEAIFAGGCFWCMEPPFDMIDGVISTTSGYTGGQVDNPTYKQVSRGATGHTEAIRIVYNPKKVTYQELLDVFWKNIDPLSGDGQFCDRGSQYRPGIFYQDEEQKKLALASRESVERRLGQPVAAEVTAFERFYDAEDYHQDYYLKNQLRYKYYRWACGRDQRLEELWGSSGKPD